MVRVNCQNGDGGGSCIAERWTYGLLYMTIEQDNPNCSWHDMGVKEICALWRRLRDGKHTSNLSTASLRPRLWATRESCCASVLGEDAERRTHTNFFLQGDFESEGGPIPATESSISCSILP